MYANIDSEGRVELVPVHKGAGILQYDYDLSKSVKLPGAHGEEIVRDLFTDTHVSICLKTFRIFMLIDRQAQITYTVGEDGQVRAWKTEASADETMDVDESADAKKKEKKDRKEKRKEKKDKKDKKRYEPY
jgi:hypothetical protein